MRYLFTILGFSLFVFTVFIGCKKEEKETIQNPLEEITQPKIDSISASKTEIQFGGQDATTLTVHATGGNLVYQWAVDLGDIIPQNTDASTVSFAGSPCCIGNKNIICSVSNEKGSVSDTISIFILEPPK